MRYKLLASSAILALVGGWDANATQIALGASTDGFYRVVGVPPASLLVLSVLPLHGPALFGASDVGSYDFGPLAITNAGPVVSGSFPMAANSQSLSVNFNDGDHLDGVVSWSQIKDGSAFPDLIGTLQIANVSGDADFTSNYSVGSTPIDTVLQFNNAICQDLPSLDQIAATGTAACLTQSSGEIINTGQLPPHVIPGVPEPNMNPIFMLSLAAVGFYVSWTSRQQSTPDRSTTS